MRHIGSVQTEKQAFIVYSYLLSHGIHSTYEVAKDEVTLWIFEEDELERAKELLNEYKDNPNDPKFAKVEFPPTPPPPPDLIAEEREGNQEKYLKEEQPRKKRSYPLTFFVIGICILLYIWNTAQQFTQIKEDGRVATKIGMTKVQQDLMFDYPPLNQKVDALLEQHVLQPYKELKDVPSTVLAPFKKAEKIPNWRGVLSIILRKFGKIPADEPVDGPLFTKIREGELWRLFTPCLLHGGLLHILFNMAWAWVLMRQIEERLPIWKHATLILLIGIISNVAQYFISGPYFLGYSGVVVGLVGFIWARQKLAPWEGYPLHRSTFIFIVIFVLAMFALELFSLLSSLIFAKELSANIANTAHIVGGIIGYLLGRIPFFARSSP